MDLAVDQSLLYSSSLVVVNHSLTLGQTTLAEFFTTQN